MLLKTLTASLLVVFGLVVLFISILRSASIQYSFSLPPEGAVISHEEKVAYELPLAGSVLPDSPFWLVKVARDRIWLALTPNKSRKADLNLLFADKRLVTSKILFEKGEYETGMMILLKAEKYLLEASFLEEDLRKGGVDTSDFLKRITIAALKHREVINELLNIAPSDAKPELIRIKDITKTVYVSGRNALQEVGEDIPKNPSEWD
jgi:hypothetical protein